MRTIRYWHRGLLLLLPLAIWCGLRYQSSVDYDNNVTVHLDRALRAVSHQEAADEMSIAVAAIDKIEAATTAVLINNSANDIAFWREQAHKALDAIATMATRGEIEEPLQAYHDRGTRMTLVSNIKFSAPDGISVAPYNSLWFFSFWGALVASLFGLKDLVVNMDRASRRAPTNIYPITPSVASRDAA